MAYKVDKGISFLKQECSHPRCNYQVMHVKKTSEKPRYDSCPQCGSPLNIVNGFPAVGPGLFQKPCH